MFTRKENHTTPRYLKRKIVFYNVVELYNTVHNKTNNNNK